MFEKIKKTISNITSSTRNTKSVKTTKNTESINIKINAKDKDVIIKDNIVCNRIINIKSDEEDK